MLEKDLNLVRKIVWSYVRTLPPSLYNMEFEDLFSEACLAYLKAQAAYNPKRGRKSTFMYTVIRNHLNDYIAAQKRIAAGELSTDKEMMALLLDTDPYKQLSPEDMYLAKEKLANVLSTLSEDARFICSLLLRPPKDLSLPNTPRKCRGEITQYLHKKKKWPRERIRKAFKEIKQAIAAHNL